MAKDLLEKGAEDSKTKVNENNLIKSFLIEKPL